MRKNLTTLLCVAALPLSASALQPQPPAASSTTQCRHNPRVVAACFELHGRMSLWEGSPGVRIWHIGTTPMLGILPSEDPIMPSELNRYAAFGVRVYGNFEVCPFTQQKPGAMQMVCVQSVSHVVVQRLRNGDQPPTITMLPGTYALAPNSSIQRTRFPRR